MRILVGTNNQGKFIEISEALTGLDLELLQLRDLSITSAPEETGSSFAENALLKASHFHELSGLPTIADDSGIMVEALQEDLGIHTRRWGAGPDASDEEWISYFLERMKEEENKRARFVCTIAFIDEKGTHHLFEGSCEGVITDTLEADYLPGLPISGCFKPDGHSAVFSALSLDQKNSTSHRGRAVQALRNFLNK